MSVLTKAPELEKIYTMFILKFPPPYFAATSAIGCPWSIEKPYTADKIPASKQSGNPLANEKELSVFLFTCRSCSLNRPATPHNAIPTAPTPTLVITQ